MAVLPIESMRDGGLLWFTDLTLADPYYAMPLLTMATFLVTIEVGEPVLYLKFPLFKWVVMA